MCFIVNGVTLCNVLRTMHCVSLAILIRRSQFQPPAVLAQIDLSCVDMPFNTKQTNKQTNKLFNAGNHNPYINANNSIFSLQYVLKSVKTLCRIALHYSDPVNEAVLNYTTVQLWLDRFKILSLCAVICREDDPNKQENAAMVESMVTEFSMLAVLVM
jgi:hypothetical protein